MAEAGESGRRGPGTGLILLAAAVLLAGGAVAYRTVGERAATASTDDDSATWRQRGFKAFEDGRFPAAAQAYEKAVALDPENAALWSSLGEARVMASARDPMPPAALAAFEKAIALDPSDPRARYFLAVKKDLDGDHRGAIAEWLALYADTPPDAPWEGDLRRTIEQVGAINKIPVDVELAAAEAKRPAGVRGPSEAQIAAAGSIPPSEQQAMAEGMVARLETRLASDPSDIDGWIMLMRSRKTLGDEARARQALHDALAANPGARARLLEAAQQLGIGAG